VSVVFSMGHHRCVAELPNGTITTGTHLLRMRHPCYSCCQHGFWTNTDCMCNIRLQ